MLIILGQLSNRLGGVLRMPPYYRQFYVGAGLVGLALLDYLVSVSLAADPAGAPFSHLQSLPATLLLYHLPLALGLTIGLAAAWRYWARLLHER